MKINRNGFLLIGAAAAGVAAGIALDGWTAEAERLLVAALAMCALSIPSPKVWCAPENRADEAEL